MRFLLVDAITSWVPGASAVGLKNVSLSEDFFDDHFPLKPIMPGVLIIEGMAQLSGLLLEETMREQQGSKVKALMSMVEKAKFRVPVYPGTQLRYLVNIEQINEFGGRIFGRAETDAAPVAECSLLFSFHTFEHPTQDAIRRKILDTWLRSAT